MKLWIIRHAKSSWSERGVSDFDRPLNKRGNRDGPVMQQWLAQQSQLPQQIFASDARRTRATSRFVCDALDTSTQLFFDHRLYLASIHAVLELVSETPHTVTSLAIIMHNPAATHLINLLVGEPVIDNLPTFGIARMETSKPWLDLTEGCAALDFVCSPKVLNS